MTEVDGMANIARDTLARYLYDRDGDHYPRGEWDQERDAFKQGYLDEADNVLRALNYRGAVEDRDRYRAALERLARPNHGVRPTGADALHMADFARDALRGR